MNDRGRIIKIDLPSQTLKDRLLYHMKSGRQSLTRKFVLSNARRDYTLEELEMDRSLRRQAGELNAKSGRLEYVVSGLQIHWLRNPRDFLSQEYAKAQEVIRNSFEGTSQQSSIPSSSRSPVAHFATSS